MPLEPGTFLKDRYRIEGRLGKGGMGAVYLAFDETLQLKVAVKENLNINPESERQFRREAKLLASLRHPNLPRVTDHFILEGRQYLVMDYIEGEDLHTRAQRQPPLVEEVLRWADGVCSALAHLHSRQPPIIHRDIKPANLKLQPDGTVVLVDFGIAKVFDQHQTTTGARGLTPGYSPPEQYGSGHTDPRSDQYSLAATLYALLTGRPPADSIARMLGKEQLKPARAFNPAIPEYVDAALTRALALDQDQRFPDINAFRSALLGLSTAATVRADSLAMPSARRRRWPLFLGLALLGAAILGGGALAVASFLPALLSAPTPTAAAPVVIQVPTGTATPLPPTLTASPAPSDTPVPTPTPLPSPTQAPAVLLGGGGRIAFVSDREDGRTLQIWTMNSDGSDPRQLTFGPGDKTQPRWSPDGRRLLFVAPGGKDRYGNNLGLDIWLINLDGTGLKNITHNVGDDTDPAWSPDGARLAFTGTRVNDLRQVFLMETTCIDQQTEDSCWSIKPRNLSAGFAVEYAPAWSPDGGTIAVAASINGAPGRIFLRSPEGGEPNQFDRSDRIIGADHLHWSPDGTLLVFTWRIAPGRNEIYLVRVEARGRDPVQLTNSLGNKEPRFSPDGQWIAFTSTRDQNPEIYLMPLSGANQQNITSHPGRDMQPDWQPVPVP